MKGIVGWENVYNGGFISKTVMKTSLELLQLLEAILDKSLLENQRKIIDSGEC